MRESATHAAAAYALLADRLDRAVNRIKSRRELTSNRAARASYDYALECVEPILIDLQLKGVVRGFAELPAELPRNREKGKR